jgi:hypothetical protein
MGAAGSNLLAREEVLVYAGKSVASILRRATVYTHNWGSHLEQFLN